MSRWPEGEKNHFLVYGNLKSNNDRAKDLFIYAALTFAKSPAGPGRDFSNGS